MVISYIYKEMHLERGLKTAEGHQDHQRQGET